MKLLDGLFAGAEVSDATHEFVAYRGLGEEPHILNVVDGLPHMYVEVESIETYGADGRAIPGRWEREEFDNGRVAWRNVAVDRARNA